MSLISKFEQFNQINFNQFLKFKIEDHHVGYIHQVNAPKLLQYLPQYFALFNNEIIMAEEYSNLDFQELTNVFNEIANVLLEKQIINTIRNEYFGVSNLLGGKALFKIDRSLVPIFAIKAKGVHLNGYVLKKGIPYLWVGKRAADKLVYPNKLDNIAAGAISYGYGAHSTLIKEAYEEASISENMAKEAVLKECFSYMFNYQNGIRNDVIFAFDLEMPETFVPFPNDGEVAKFQLINAVEVLDILINSNDFKFNSALVIISFLVRFNIITSTDYPCIEEFFYNNKALFEV